METSLVARDHLLCGVVHFKSISIGSMHVKPTQMLSCHLSLSNTKDTIVPDLTKGQNYRTNRCNCHPDGIR